MSETQRLKYTGPNPASANAPASRNVTALPAVVADAYAVFSRYPAPQAPLDACVACCMPADLELQMRQWALRKLTRQHFYEYNTSAKSEIQPAPEMLYLLPRLLELMTEGAELHHSTELYLDRVGRCPSTCWKPEERAVLDRFALAHFSEQLAKGRDQCLDDPMSLLLMYDIGGISLQPMLDFWSACELPQSTSAYVEARYWYLFEGNSVANAFAENRPAFRAQMDAWLHDPVCRSRFASRLTQAEFLRLASFHPDIGHTPFKTMVDTVFDNLMQ